MKEKLVGIIVVLVCASIVNVLFSGTAAYAQDVGDGADEGIVEVEEEVEPETTDGEPDLIDEESESLEDLDGNGLMKVTSEVGVQSVLSDRIPLVVTVEPRISSSKAQISWSIPRGLATNDETSIWFSMEEGVKRTFRIDVEPIVEGTYKIVVDVTAWRYDTNYVASTDLSFDIDKNLHVDPPPEEYTRNEMMFRVTVVILIILAIIGGIFGLKFAIKRFRQWLAED